ncbi:MarR family winged helix-turn-helix transcriptional regulator [Enterococcus sp. AZ196]|uniref:MarR family winged helix-turn-helix transcriptional regulator n=1 Tax=Enterococcus sp. AZ196 TaxID=2774659 RepID=UPI003D2DC9E2
MDSFVKMINRIAQLSALYREKEFKKLGLGEMHHAYILSVCADPGISQEQLACKIFINKSNVARQLAQLEQKGFITRQSDQNDARRLRIFPTEKSLALESEIRSILAAWNQTLLAEIPAEQQKAVLVGLQAMMEKAETELCSKEQK